jgi:type I restriction enzyme, S subunit
MSAQVTAAHPTGRKKPAQGKERSDAALGHASQNTPSPQMAKQGGELPSGWIRLRMGEVGRWFGGGTPSKANPRFWTGGNIPWVSPKDMKVELITDAQDHITEDAVAQSATNLVEAGSVLIVVRSGILQHTLPVAVASRQVALNQDLKAVKPLENIRSDYLALALKAFERDILHTCTKTGTTVQSLELPVFLRFQIPVAPVPEQRRIVAEIEKQFTRLEAGVAALRRVQANLKRYRAAVLKAACEGRLVENEVRIKNAEGGSVETGEQLLKRILTERRRNWQGRGQYKEPAAPDTGKLPPLPEGWTWASPEQLSAADLYSLAIGPFGSNLKVSDYTDSGVPLIFVRNVRAGSFTKAKEVFVTENKAAELKAHQVSGGDILVTKMGAPPGDACLYPVAAPTAVITADCIKFRPSPLLPEKRFFVCALNSLIVKPQIADITKGVAQMKVSLGRFEGIALPLPPLAEQTRIVAEVERRLSVVEELESVVTANLQRATRLRQSILQKAFTGNLA